MRLSIFDVPELYSKYDKEISYRRIGTLVDNCKVNVAKEDIKVTKLLKVRQSKIQTIIRNCILDFSNPIMSSDSLYDKKVSYSNHLTLLNTVGIHSLHGNGWWYYPKYLGFFSVDAIIPKDTEYITGLDGYNPKCGIIVSKQLLIPKIEIIDSYREGKVIYYILQQGDLVYQSAELIEYGR